MQSDWREFSLLASRMLADEFASVPVKVAQLERPVLWQGPRTLEDPEMSQFAVRITHDGAERAWADRYGGTGLSGNGGSGRAALYRGMYVKGIGATPLVGRTTDAIHASGDAYLEEAVRETIFAEIFAYETPWGAVRTKAVIDILEDQYWELPPRSGIELERRVLLVREPLLRLAHLERAIHFTGQETLTGASDVRRVERNKSILEEHVGFDQIEARLRQFWMRWCDQSAYLYVARLTAGPPSTSNIALDGRLLDFGAATSLPSWCSTVICPGALETGNDFPQLAQYMHSFYAEHHDGSLTRNQDWQDYVAELTLQCQTRYLRTVGIEMLRLAGLRRSTIEREIAGHERERRLVAAVEAALNRYLRIFQPSVYAADAAQLWDFESFWNDDPPRHLHALRSVADAIASGVRGEPVRERMHARCKPRKEMFRRVLQDRLDRQLPQVQKGDPVNKAALHDLIAREITAARRDTALEPRLDRLWGFAAIGAASYVLFRRADGEVYAIEETSHGVPPPKQTLEKAILRFERDSIDGKTVEVVHVL